MPSKHDKTVWEILDFDNIKSTETIRQELMEKSGKKINWFLVYKILKNFEEKGQVKRFENRSGIFWLKK